jgi:hypothetical protein
MEKSTHASRLWIETSAKKRKKETSGKLEE